MIHNPCGMKCAKIKRSTSTNIVPWVFESDARRCLLYLCVFRWSRRVVALSIDFLFFANCEKRQNAEPKATERHLLSSAQTKSYMFSVLGACSLSLALNMKKTAFFMLAFVWMYASLHRTQNECDDWKQMSNGKSLRSITETKNGISRMKGTHEMRRGEKKYFIDSFFGLFLFFLFVCLGLAGSGISISLSVRHNDGEMNCWMLSIDVENGKKSSPKKSKYSFLICLRGSEHFDHSDNRTSNGHREKAKWENSLWVQ